MNWITHFLFSMNLLLIFLGSQATIKEMIIFTIIFALFVDLDFIFTTYVLKKEGLNHRTLLQEPFGLLFIGVPIGLLFGYFFQAYYFFLVIIPFFSHIFLDYVTIHNVHPYLPFSKKEIKVGFIRQIIESPRRPFINNKPTLKGFNELHLILLNVILFLVLLYFNYNINNLLSCIR
jgi:membrane-bound metal-dependent hydrolase YbcI (DUF457 family)